MPIADCATLKVTKLLDELRTTEPYDEEGEPDLEEQHGPALVTGGFSGAPMSELLAYLPDPAITTLLVDRFFQGKEPAWRKSSDGHTS